MMPVVMGISSSSLTSNATWRSMPKLAASARTCAFQPESVSTLARRSSPERRIECTLQRVRKKSAPAPQSMMKNDGSRMLRAALDVSGEEGERCEPAATDEVLGATGALLAPTALLLRPLAATTGVVARTGAVRDSRRVSAAACSITDDI